MVFFKIGCAFVLLSLKMMMFGLCVSDIVAGEKFKKLKNGDLIRYAYYVCKKHNDSRCKNPITKEEKLIEQLANLIFTISNI